MAKRWLAMRKRKRQLWKLDNRKNMEVTKQKQIVIQFLGRRYISIRSRELFRRQLWCSIEKVWDIDRKRIFWHNHQTGVSDWNQPTLLRRYGDVENPCVWQAMGVDSATGGGTEVNYWHVLAGRQIDRKPDGFVVCGSCLYHIATRHCYDCQFDYCFGCFRTTHQSPFGFLQNATITKENRMDPAFLTCLQCCTHKWGPVKKTKCDMCNSDKVNAAMFCENCNKNFCRRCHRRIHKAPGFGQHSSYLV